MRSELERLYTRRSAIDRLIDALEVYQRYQRPELVGLKKPSSVYEEPRLAQVGV